MAILVESRILGLERDMIALCIIAVGESLIDNMDRRCKYDPFVYYSKHIGHFYKSMYLREIDIRRSLRSITFDVPDRSLIRLAKSSDSHGMR
jgi:hypothetical protein